MIRDITLTLAFIVAAAIPVAAQGHPGHGSGTHPPHGPGHVRPDSATHGAMHSVLHGSWQGTLRSPQGVSSALAVSVAQDSLRNLRITMRADQTAGAGHAGRLVMDGETLQWTQDLSGVTCSVTAVVAATTTAGNEERNVMRGRLMCEGVEHTFTAIKRAE